MLVRLAFSLMLEVDADILLIDEVFAVGDAAFQQKCADAFRQMKAEGKTIILVTHEMSTVEEYCDRAMLIAAGRIDHLGDPAEVGRRYLRLNFEGAGGDARRGGRGADNDEVLLRDIWIEDENGERATGIEQGVGVRLRAELEILRDAPGGLAFGFVIANADGVGVSELGQFAADGEGAPGLTAGRRVTILADLENLLTPGRYFVHCGVSRAQGRGVAMYEPKALDFVVFGDTSHARGIVTLPHEIRAEVEEGGG
jgi:energy-coupling factor transporter ATP-binding protein EcfA2